MLDIIAALAVAASASPTSATDFGIRTVGPLASEPKTMTARPALSRNFDIRNAAVLGGRWGTVTSTRRSVARNRAVRGARNSYHLVGRAIDIARRPGVRHSQIEAAFRNAGYTLIESLDEGDHSHFAFGAPRAVRALTTVPVTAAAAAGATNWRIVAAPN